MKKWNFGNLWSYEVHKKLIENDAKKGDFVENVGYFHDCNKNNYKKPTIKTINKFQVMYEFDEV